jgi:E1-E2 ATPase
MTDLAGSAGGGSATVAGRRAPDRDLAPPGLSEAEAERRLAGERRPRRAETSRSYASIGRANVLTVFNLILAVFGMLVRRDDQSRALAPEQLVVDDIVVVQPGDQLIADGTLLAATDLHLDESVLTGESEPAGHLPGDSVLSGAFVVEGPAPTASLRSASTASPPASPGRRAHSGIRARRWSARSTGCSVPWSGWSSRLALCSGIRYITVMRPFIPLWPRRPPGW